MNYIEVRLPMPPSVNTAYAGKTIRFKSKKYKEWEKQAYLTHKFLNENDTIEGDRWLKVTYTFYFGLYNKNGSKKIKDVFNYEKLTSDFLTHIVKGFEDHKIKIGLVVKENSEEEYVVVKIEEI